MNNIFFWSCVTLLGLVLTSCNKGHLIKKFNSPQGDFELKAYRYSEKTATPGDAGQGPGYIDILDSNGEKIHTEKYDIFDRRCVVGW